MDALEAWSTALPYHVMEQHYHAILPCLDSFLKTTEQGRLYSVDMVQKNEHRILLSGPIIVGLLKILNYSELIKKNA